jgi:uncharacterized protein (DUF1015 family)
MGLYDGDTHRRFVLSFTSDDPLAATHRDKPGTWRQLDVAILQHAIVEGVLKRHFEATSGGVGYGYTADLGEVKTMTEAQTGQLGIIMQATPLLGVMDVALAGEVMPPKSTFFYPKLATGLVINPLG